MKTFSDLGISSWMIDTLRSMAITNPTDIQQACIPEILNGKDVIGNAKTGSGKTATFALPILQNLAQDPYGVYALILTPTRELAYQIAEQFRVLGAGINLKQSVVVGGMDMMKQALELSKKPHIVIATPGRLVDHINSSSNAIHFKRIKYLVLDEADRLVHSSFAADLNVVLSQLPKQRQNLLFTATITPELTAIKFSSEKSPFYHSCAEQFDTVEKLDQRYMLIPSQIRDAYLTWLLRNKFEFVYDKNNKIKDDDNLSGSVIIFVSKCSVCQRLLLMLKNLGVKCTALHSKMTQNERLNSLAKFKSMIVPVLITTDVGSRGLDIPSVKVVINYILPSDAADYVHRVGRTARAGRGGLALSFITERDIDLVLNIEEKIKKKLEEYEQVDEKVVLPLLNEVSLAQREASMSMFDNKFGEKAKINKRKRIIE